MKNLPAPFYRDLINKLQELYILCEPVWDADGRLNDIRILDVNDACLERLKRPREKIIASTYSELLPPNNNTYSLLSELDAVARDGSEKRFELRFENPDVYFDIFACAPQPGQIVILINEITDRKKLQIRIRQLTHLYTTLKQIKQKIVRIKNRGDLFHAICGVAVNYGLFSLAWVGVLDESSGDILPQAAVGLDVKQWPYETVNIHSGSHKDELSARAIRSFKVMVNGEITNDHSSETPENKSQNSGYRSIAYVPFKMGGKTGGLLCLASAESGFFNNPDEVSLLEEIGQNVSYALEVIQTEQERQENEKLLVQWADAFNHCAHGIAIGLPSSNTLLTCNPALARLQGRTVEEISGMPILDMYHPSQHPFVKQCITAADRDGSVCYETLMVRKDGSTYPVQMDLVSVRDAQGKILYRVATQQDISERKHAEQVSQEYRDKLEAALEAMSDAVYISDMGGRFINFNEAFATFHRFKTKEECSKVFADYPDILDVSFANGEPAPVEMWALPRALRGETVSNAEYGLRRKDTGECWIGSYNFAPIRNRDGEIIGSVVVGRDITEQKKAQEALRKSEHMYRLLADNTLDVIWVLDTESMYFTYISPSVYALRGYTPEEIMAVPMDDALMPEDREKRRAVIRNTAAEVKAGRFTRSEYAVNEVEQPCKDGSSVWTEVTTHYYLNPENGHVEVVGITRNISERKRAQDDIRENEEKLRLFIEHAPASLAMFDKRMCYQAVSNRWINDYHLEGREILGHSHYEIFPEISEEWKAIHRRALAGEVISADEDAFHRLDGSTQWLKWEVRPWYRSDQSIGGIVVFSEDISLAKEVTDELRQSEERFSKIFSSSPVGTSLIRAADQVFVAINQAALQISGFTREEVLGKTSLDLGINATLEQRQENYRHINQSGMIHNADATLRRKDGSLRRVLLSAQFLEIKGQKFILSQMIDDTERKQALEALSRERENFFKLFYNSPAAMVVSRRSDGQIKTVNDTYTRLIGYSAGELVGHTPIDYPLYVNPDERSFILQLLKEKGQIQNYELLIRSRSGEIITVVLSMEPLVYNEEDCLLSALINISDRKLAEQEVQRLNSDLERRVTERTTQLAAANKELEAFAYSVSHDLRAPLRRINGWSQILFEDDYEKLDEQGREYLKTIRSETRRMSALIDDMLRLSQISRIEMAYTRVDMSALARSISDRLINEQTERQVNFVIQPGLTVMGDEKLLEIMLTNLLSNAFKFTSRNSAARIEFGRMQKDDHPTWFVRDNGVGFDMAHAKNLFGPFQRLHSQAEFPGTGVGLATVQRVINRHGGLIWAEAETNVGAVFYFTLNAG